jgi:sec-independent protein translocase protein TatB
VLENLNGWELVALLLVALFIFGDRLPKVLGDGMRMVRRLRGMAQGATADLSRELGTDIQLEDLHPKAFIRKHLLSEEDEAAIRKPLQTLLDDVKQDLNGVKTEITDVAKAADLKSAPVPAEAPRPAQRFDLDAT